MVLCFSLFVAFTTKEKSGKSTQKVEYIIMNQTASAVFYTTLYSCTSGRKKNTVKCKCYERYSTVLNIFGKENNVLVIWWWRWVIQITKPKNVFNMFTCEQYEHRFLPYNMIDRGAVMKKKSETTVPEWCKMIDEMLTVTSNFRT